MENVGILLKKAFDPFVEMPLHVWESFAAHGEIYEAKKNEIIKSFDQIEKHMHFILKGSGGIFLYKENNSVCTDLCFEGDFFGDYLSFLKQQVTGMEVICFEDSTLFKIDRTNFRKLASTEFGKVISQMAADNLFIQKQTQQLDLLSKTAEERYREILKKYPDVVLRTPSKYLASYLGITPESLSRIRGKLQ